VEETIRFGQFTAPVQKLFRDFLAGDIPAGWFRPPTRAWWTASRPRTRATCKTGPTWRIRAPGTCRDGGRMYRRAPLRSPWRAR
jgi:hypothetical protein